jgi:hypothetical protein
MLPLKARKNMQACEVMLAEIEAELLVKLTQAVRQRNFQERAYAVLICYVDLTPERWLPPYPTVLWEKDRENRRGSDLWSLPDLPDAFQCAMPESETLERRCSLVYDFLTQEDLDQPEEELILPFRKMVYRVSLILNRLDWSKILPVTDDFVVMASDWTSCWIEEDAKHSVPPAKQERLKQKGFYFNTYD